MAKENNARCEFAGCVFPREPRQKSCAYHIAMFGISDRSQTSSDENWLAENHVPRKNSPREKP